MSADAVEVLVGSSRMVIGDVLRAGQAELSRTIGSTVRFAEVSLIKTCPLNRLMVALPST
jgi:hypothetical protein